MARLPYALLEEYDYFEDEPDLSLFQDGQKLPAKIPSETELLGTKAEADLLSRPEKAAAQEPSFHLSLRLVEAQRNMDAKAVGRRRSKPKSFLA